MYDDADEAIRAQVAAIYDRATPLPRPGNRLERILATIDVRNRELARAISEEDEDVRDVRDVRADAVCLEGRTRLCALRAEIPNPPLLHDVFAQAAVLVGISGVDRDGTIDLYGPDCGPLLMAVLQFGGLSGMPQLWFTKIADAPAQVAA